MEGIKLFTEDEIENLFSDTGVEDSTPETKKEEKEQEDNNNKTTEVDVDNLFAEPESVGSEEENKEKGNTSSKEASTSPDNFYASIANALVEDGVAPDLDIDKIEDAESFADAIKDYISSQLDDTQKRINEALNNGVEPSAIKYYENTLNNLNTIDDDFIENEENETFRKNAILQDLMNKGYSKEEAQEELQEILDNGTDVKRAKRALNSLKDFYSKEYKKLLDNAKEEAAKEEKEQKEKMEKLRKDMLEGSLVFGDVELTKEDRRKSYEAITKPIWKDPDTGEFYTAIQKYEREHREDFLKKLGVLYVMTNGFENIDNLVQGKVKKESRKALRDLESKINSTRRNSDGNLSFASGTIEDSNSILRGYSLDI